MNSEGDTLARRAAELYRSGRYREAREAYRTLLNRDPARPDDWVNYGLLLRQGGAPSEALSAYSHALRYGATGAHEVHLNRAVVMADDLGDAEGAHAELEAALALAPDYVPALLNLGNLHDDAGERESAREVYARVLHVEPGNPLALMRLAEVTAFKDPADPLVKRLEEALSQNGIRALERADLGYALGRALDQCKSYDAAFDAYRNANEGSRELARHPYSAAGAEGFIDALIAAFPSAPECPMGDGKAPIFICGMFRSGSTLVERIICSHSGVTAGGELPFLPRLVREQLQPYPASLAGRGREFYARLGENYRSGLLEMGLRGLRLTDKRPDNFLHVGLIKRLFPDAKIVLTRRNPLDNCLSVYFAHLDPALVYAASLESVAHWYCQYERLAAHWLAIFPGDIHVADYDALVANPADEIAELLAFLDLDWEDSCLEPHKGEGHVRTASAWQVREPLYTRSSGRWCNYAPHLGALFDVFGGPNDP